jgi:hypothetical protein
MLTGICPVAGSNQIIFSIKIVKNKLDSCHFSKKIIWLNPTTGQIPVSEIVLVGYFYF